MAEPSPLDADWDALSPEKKAQLQALVTRLDMAKVYQGAGGAFGVGGKTGQEAYADIATKGGLPKDQLAALARFRAYNINHASDPNWQGPPQAPITGPIAEKPSPQVIDQRREQLATAQTPEQRAAISAAAKQTDDRAAIDQRYASFAKPEPEQQLAQKPLRMPPLDRTAPEEPAAIPDVPDDAPEHSKIGAGFLHLLQSLGLSK